MSPTAQNPMRLISAVVLAVGLALVAGTATAPRYEPENWNQALLDLERGMDSDEASSRYFAAQDAHRTRASHIQDLGRGVAALGGSLLLVLSVAGVRDWSTVREWRSPRRAGVVVAAAAGSWCALLGAELWWLGYTARRGDYPPWADSIGIPIFWLARLAVVTLPLIGLFLVLGLRRSSLPASVKDLRPSPRFWIATLGSSLIAFALLAGLVRDVRDGAFPSVAASVFALSALAAWWPAAAAPRAV